MVLKKYFINMDIYVFEKMPATEPSAQQEQHMNTKLTTSVRELRNESNGGFAKLAVALTIDEINGQQHPGQDEEGYDSCGPVKPVELAIPISDARITPANGNRASKRHIRGSPN